MKNKGIAIAVVCCACALALSLVGCGGSSSGSTAPASGSGGASASGSASAGAAGASGAAASDYTDAHGYLTVKALVELDGKALAQAAEDAGYEWNDASCLWKKTGSSVMPSRALTQVDYDAAKGLDAFNFTLDEVDAFAAGAAGTPVMWTVSNSKAAYSGADEILADQQVDVVEQCAIDNAAYGTETWALVQNGANDRFLLEIRYDGDKLSGDVLVYTADYVATEANGIASAFLFVPDGLYDAHTIDECWAALKAAAA